MNNLTDYELLQHRHLSLLRALQDKGVTCVMEGREWKVSMPVKCNVCMDHHKVRNGIDSVPCPACAFGVIHVTSESLATVDIYRRKDACDEWTVNLAVVGDDVTGSICGMSVRMPHSPLLGSLLTALHAAIMAPAPAKA